MSRHRIVNPPELGEPSGFSHAVVASGRTVHRAGQIGAGATLAAQFDDALADVVGRNDDGHARRIFAAVTAPLCAKNLAA